MLGFFELSGANESVVGGLLLFRGPELRHLLQRLSFGFGHEARHKPGSQDADAAVEHIYEEVAETLSHVTEGHVVHWHERRRHDEIENPLEGHSDSHGTAADGVGEYLGNEHPAYRAP